MFKVYLDQWQMWSLRGTENPKESDRNGTDTQAKIKYSLEQYGENLWIVLLACVNSIP